MRKFFTAACLLLTSPITFAAIVFVGKATAVTSTGGASTLQNTYAPTAGNVVVVFAAAGNAYTPPTLTLTDSRGNSIPAAAYTLNYPAQEIVGEVWVIPVTGGGAGNFTVTSSLNAVISLDVLEYSGMGTALDGTPTGNTASASSGTLTTTQSTSLLFVGGINVGVNATATAHTLSGFTQRENNHISNFSSCSGESIGLTAGAYSDTISWTGNGYEATLIVGIKIPPPAPLLTSTAFLIIH